MPADTNQNGDIFGGWLLSQMDIGGGIFASKIAKSRTVTVAIEAMNFRKPVYVGDLVSVHANLVRIGRTSITVHLEAWVMRRKEMQFDPGDRRQFHLRLDRRSGPSAASPAGRPADSGVAGIYFLKSVRPFRTACRSDRNPAIRRAIKPGA